MTLNEQRRRGGDIRQVLDFIGGGNVAETRKRPANPLISKRRRKRRQASIPFGDTARARTRGRAAPRSHRRAMA
jgi:hypothetical protein